MERVGAEMDRLLGALRSELQESALARRSSRGLLVRTWSLRWALAQGERRRCRTLAAQFDLSGQGRLRDLVESWAVDDDIVERDAEAALWDLGADAAPPPLDASMWEAYLDSLVVARPWTTLGAMAAWQGLADAAIRFGEERQERSVRLPMSGFVGVESRWEELLALLRDEAIQRTIDAGEAAELLEGFVIADVVGRRMVRWALGREEAGFSGGGRLTRWAAGQN